LTAKRSSTAKARDDHDLQVLQQRSPGTGPGATKLQPKNMRPAFVIVIAVLLVALLAFDTYQYDGHYRAAAWEQAKHGVEQIEHQVDDLLGTRGH